MTTKKAVPKKRVAVAKGGPKKVTVKSMDIEDIDIHQPAAVPLIMYRRIALTFIVLVAAALMAVLYLSTVEAVISVDSNQSNVETEFVAGVFETPTRTTDVRGKVVSGKMTKTQSFTPSGEGSTQVDGVAKGSVTIINDSSSAQALVATTRFLSEDEVLFRLEDGVTVPANGRVEARVYADVEGVIGDIASTTFTIPGLSPTRQTQVYAESTQTFVGGVSTIAVVSQTEMDASAQQLQEAMVTEAKEMLLAQAGETFTGESYDVKVLETTYSIEPNTQSQGYDVTVSLSVTAVYYDQEALEKIAVAKLYEGLGQGQDFVNVDAQSMTTRVEGVDESAGQANIMVSLSVPAVTSSTSNALEVSRFVGMTEAEVRDLLVGEGVAKNVSVEFFPFWIKTVPRLKDHIYVNIR